MSEKQRRQGKRMCVKREAEKASQILNKNVAFDLNQLQISVKKLHSYKADLVIADAAVLSEITDAAKAEQEINESAAYNDDVLDIISRAEVAIEAAIEQSAAARQPATSAGAATGAPQKVTLRLPKLELAPFAGEPLEWQSFWDSFDNSVHSNPNLSAIDKFNYLKGLLVGDALKAVEGYRMTAENYTAVVDALTERFGNKQQAIFAHFEAMLALPQVSHDVSQLQSVSDACEQHIRSLVALGLDESTFAQVFTPIMLSKLPKFVKIELHRRNGSQIWSLAHLREWLKDEIRARDMSERSFGEGRQVKSEGTTTVKSKHGSSHVVAQKQPTKPVSSAAALVSDSAPQRSVACAFCGGSHFSDQCEKYPDTNSRKQQAKGRCFGCLSTSHQLKACKRKVPCVYCKKRGHHRSFCYSKFGGPDDSAGKGTIESGLNVDAAEYKSAGRDTVAGDTPGKRTILQTAFTKIFNRETGCGVQARLLFDTAGSRSFITEHIRQQLNLPIKGEEVISIAGFQSKKRSTAKYKTVELSVQCSDGSTQLMSASVVPSITCPIQKIPISVEQHPVLKTLHLAEPLVSQPEFVAIDVLVGLDFYYDFVTTERVQCPNGPLLLSSKLGYIATGRISTRDSGPETIAVMFLNADAAENQGNSFFSVERFWNLEDVDMKDAPKQLSGDDEALRYHCDTLEQEPDGRYISRWPWKLKEPELADNFDVAFGRLTSLLRRVASNPELFAAYGRVIADQLQKGIIEVAPSKPTGPSVYHMPHHCVVTPTKTTTKLRIVYDASSKSSRDSLSLNDCLHRGPILLEDLCGLLMRFRLQPVALVSDIEKAFLQIGLHVQERDVTRFLWINNAALPAVGENLIVYRFTRIPFGVISSPFVLENTVCQHLLRWNSDVSLKMLKDHYVDNVITGEASSQLAASHYREAKTIFHSARMNLREWYTNSSIVREVFADADKGQEPIPKVLGLRWDYNRDTLSSEFPQRYQNNCSVVTKRAVLKVAAQVFDPLGVLAPVTVSAKIFVQDLWKAGYDWDEELPDDVVAHWKKILLSLWSISDIVIPRFVGSTAGVPLELHVFCDASMRACAAVVYLRTIFSQTTCHLILSKTRLAPAKTAQTIPRLELIAAVIGTRLMAFTSEQLRRSIAKKYVWTDSQCTLHWIQREQVSARFVENRVNEIRKHDDVEFRYVPSEDNPADLSSRGCDADKLCSSAIWWTGPPWLALDESSWPAANIVHKKSASEVELVVSDKTVPASDVVDVTRFSMLSRLLRCTAFVLRFISNTRTQKSDRIVGSLSAKELGFAQQHLIRATQATHFAELLKERSGWKAGLVRQLGVFQDSDGLLRCSGRLAAADLSYDAKYPILLPKNSHLTDLIIFSCHAKLLHAGVAETLAQLRERYWVIHGRNSVRRVIRKCVRCRRAAGGPFKVPPAPDLPVSRVTEAPAFSYVGIDYLGPLHVKNGDVVRKVWVVLFTCMVVRAVHLDLVEELSTEQFLMSLRRFIAVYGVPRQIVSDNASQFRLAGKVIDKLWKQLVESSCVRDFAASSGIEWQFIVEFAPWMGGFYERLIGVVKCALKRTFQNVLATSVELLTILFEISAVVNSRPLVYVENEVGSQILTPAHFLPKGIKPGLPSFPNAADEFLPKPSQTDVLIGKWKWMKSVGDQFWSSWRNMYLLSLRERENTQRQRNCSTDSPKLGDVVLIKDSSPRGLWRIARISELNRSKDGLVRSAVVKLSSGKHLRRAIKLLYPLEVGECPPTEVGDCPPTSPEVRAEVKGRSVPRRRAASVARTRWQRAAMD